MRAEAFHRLLIMPALLAGFARLVFAAPPQHQTHLAKDHVAPLVALKEAVELLPASAAKTAVTPQEMELFSKIADGHLDQVKASELVLTVAGVTDANTQKRYLAKLDNITAEARKAIAKGATPDERAFFLADYLRHGPLHGGEEYNQVDMLKLLDTGKFNCVSAAILYNLVGNRLGLKTQVVSIPGHVFLHMADFYIEPTSGKTLTAEDHRAIEDEHWRTATDYWKAVFGTARHYESNNLSLIGQVYFDNDGELFNKHQYEAAAILGLKALCLDSNQPMFTYSLKLDMESWFKDTLQRRNDSKAKQIAIIYGQLFGNSPNKLAQQLAAKK